MAEAQLQVSGEGCGCLLCEGNHGRRQEKNAYDVILLFFILP